MKNKRNCIASDIFAKYRCIENIFTKNMGSSIVHFLVLMLSGCNCIGTAGAAALRVDGGAVCIILQKVELFK